MTSHSPPLVFYNSNGQPTADDILAFFCSQSMHAKNTFSVGLHVVLAQGGLNDTFTCSQGPNFALKWDSGSNLSICTVGLVGKHCP